MDDEDDDDYQFMKDFELQLEECQDIDLIRDYVKNSSKQSCRLIAFPVTDGRVEYSFTSKHPRDTYINGLKSIKGGSGCWS